MNFSELEKIEGLAAATGWGSPLSAEDKEFIKYFRSVFKRYNINPSKATRLEYGIVESEPVSISLRKRTNTDIA